MSIDLTGIQNVGEFYSHHYLDALLENDLKSLFTRWRADEEEETTDSTTTTDAPDRALNRCATPFFEAKSRALRERRMENRWRVSYRIHVQLLEALGVAPLFGAICGRDSFPYTKPDPRHLTGTIERAGGDPRHAIMVGDSRTDIDTARNAGLPVIGVTFGYTDVPVRDLGPDVAIDHFDALEAAVVALSPRKSAVA